VEILGSANSKSAGLVTVAALDSCHSTTVRGSNQEPEMDIQVRKAEPQDTPVIAELLRSLGFFAHINAEEPGATQDRVARHFAMCDADDSHSVFVAQGPAGEILGYGAVHWLPYLILAGPEGYISELFVRESHRGQGIGSQLLKVMEAEARERGCSRLMLINLRKRESYRRRFYHKQGWEEREGAANFVYPL
jgi:GNAT superfamily N-acetyltransferase